MYISIPLLYCLVSLVVASAHPEVTAAPRSPAHYQDRVNLLELQRKAAALVNKRQKPGELRFCFGDNSICENSNNLNDECDPFSNFKDPTKWYECLCENGYVSTREVCGWCNDAWGIAQLGGINELNSEACSSYSFTIAPVPESILALQSSYNSTWTGTLLGTATISGDGGLSRTLDDDSTTTTRSRIGGGQTGVQSEETEESTTSRRLRPSLTDDDVFTTTVDGGGLGPTATKTVDGFQNGPGFGDDNGNGGSATSAPTGQAAGGSSGAAGLNLAAGFTFSVLVFGLIGMMLL